jgi:hypothetical protein
LTIKKPIVLLCAALAASSCGEVPLHPLDPGFETFACDFETGNIHDYRWSDYSLAHDDSFQIVTAPEPVHSGTSAGRFIVRKGDQPTTGTRAELGLSDLYGHNTEVCYGWSFYIDPASEEVDKWQLLGQWHDAPDPLLNEDWSGYIPMSPPLSVLYQNGRLSLVLRSTELWGDGKKIGSVAVNKGEWIDLTFRIRWSVYDDGFVSATVNGTPITGSAGNGWKAKGRNLRNKAGNFLRIGVYRDDSISTPLTVFYDDIRVAGTLAEVTP